MRWGCIPHQRSFHAHRQHEIADERRPGLKMRKVELNLPHDGACAMGADLGGAGASGWTHTLVAAGLTGVVPRRRIQPSAG